MLNYLKDTATLMSDTTPRYGQSHGWYSTFVRVNTDSIGGWTSQGGLVNSSQFNGWIQNFVVPFANHLRTRGMYLVLSATGPINTPNNGTHNAGVTEQQRLITFWQTVANAPGVKSADNIMFELMNEPVDVESVPGQRRLGQPPVAITFQAFKNWTQPIINAIRNTGRGQRDLGSDAGVAGFALSMGAISLSVARISVSRVITIRHMAACSTIRLRCRTSGTRSTSPPRTCGR